MPSSGRIGPWARFGGFFFWLGHASLLLFLPACSDDSTEPGDDEPRILGDG